MQSGVWEWDSYTIRWVTWALPFKRLAMKSARLTGRVLRGRLCFDGVGRFEEVGSPLLSVTVALNPLTASHRFSHALPIANVLRFFRFLNDDGTGRCAGD